MAGAPMALNTPAKTSSKLSLTPEIVSRFRTARTFKRSESFTPADAQAAGQDAVQDLTYTSLAYSERGDWLLACNAFNEVELWDCMHAKKAVTRGMHKYGVSLPRFTHNDAEIIQASTKGEHIIRHANVGKGKAASFIRYFRGHEDRVVSLEMSPMDDTFLSAALDDSVRLWDLRGNDTAQGVMKVAGHSSVAFDPSGQVFAVMLNLHSSIAIYDLRNFDQQPFLCRQVDSMLGRSQPGTVTYTSVKFSNDGKMLLLGTGDGQHYVLDAFSGDPLCTLQCPTPPGSEEHPESASLPYVTGTSGNEVAWTPDARYVFSGSSDGRVHVWDVAPPQPNPTRPPPGPNCVLQPLKTFEGHAPTRKASRAVAFNPHLAMLATAGGDQLALWAPDTGDDTTRR